MLQSRFTLKIFGKLCTIPNVSIARASGRYKIQSEKATLNLDLHCKTARKRELFLEQVEQVVLYAKLVSLIAPYYSKSQIGRPPFALEPRYRAHFMQ